jgi:uncharacterized protein YjbI with pentapeptide repeats
MTISPSNHDPTDTAGPGNRPEVTNRERHSFSFRHEYGLIRTCIWRVFNRDQYVPPVRAIMALASIVMITVDLPIRWLMTLLDAVIGDRGYLPVGSIVGAYLVVFGLIDAKHQQEETRASFERSQFVTLVSGNADSFVAASKDFGKVQTMRATAHPELFKPWSWGQTTQPNLRPLWSWAHARFQSCDTQSCSKSTARIDLFEANLDGADLGGVKLTDTDLTGANVAGANLSDADLSRASLTRARLFKTKLNGAKLLNTRLNDANLHRANLSGASLHWADLRGTNLRDANLHGVNLTDTSLTGVDLTDADLTDADLTDAIVTQIQLDKACGTNAKLPSGLSLKPCASGAPR